jgi:hypothetical protein
MTYTHVPTPLRNADPKFDREVHYNGETIARVAMEEHPRSKGNSAGAGNGLAESLNEALQVVKNYI